MKRSKFSDEQILKIVREGEAGRKVADLCRTHGITEQTYYRWKSKVRRPRAQRDAAAEAARGRESPPEADRGRANARHSGVESGGGKKVVGPSAKRVAVGWLVDARTTSLRRACRVVGLSTATWRYRRRGRADNAALLARLQVHAAVRARYGYRRLHTLIAREGVVANHKRVHRVYREAGLQVRRRRRKRITRGRTCAVAAPE